MAFYQMKMFWHNLMQKRGMQRDFSWSEEKQGPVEAPTWISSLYLLGALHARESGRTISAARDKAAYMGLTLYQIPLLYPSPQEPYKYLKMTLTLEIRLEAIGHSRALTWEPDIQEGKAWKSEVLLYGKTCGMGIGPAIICAKDMASYYALGELEKGLRFSQESKDYQTEGNMKDVTKGDSGA